MPETGHGKKTRNAGELTLLSVGLGLVIAVVMTAANVYMGLKVGLTISASIPAAVLGLAAYRMLGRKDLKAVNIVQTLASSGESLAAGAIFTVPALVLVGAWQDFRFWPTTLIVVCGGLLGIAFMVPLRRILIVESPELTYPEGVACAAVLKSGEQGRGGVAWLFKGFLVGAGFKALATGTGLGLYHGTWEWATRLGGGEARADGRLLFFGSDLSPALLSVGLITGLGVSFQVFLGGAISWLVAMPLLAVPEALKESVPLEAAWGMWSKQIRYLGVGAMVVGGLWSIFSMRSGLAKGVASLGRSFRKEAAAGAPAAESERDMPGRELLTLLGIGMVLTFALYLLLLKAPLMALLTTGAMAVAAFLFVAVSSYIVGLVGSSNNPVSGMTISALLGTAAFFLVLGFRGDSAVLATLGVAAVVCCAACSAGDCSQDLKTGHLVGSSPRLQQYAEVIGAVLPVMVIAPVLSLLHHGYVIGSGELKAPQATLFASLTQGIFGQGGLPLHLVAIGAGIGAALILADGLLKARGSALRLHPMPVAVGLYLPLTLSVPIFLGGLLRWFATRGKREAGPGTGDVGILAGSGLIAGESIMGVLLALFVYLKWKLQLSWQPAWLPLASLAAFLGLMAWMGAVARRRLE